MYFKIQQISGNEIKPTKHKKPRKRRCAFIDDEASVSGDQSSDDESSDDNNFIATQFSQLDQSNDVVDTSIDMQAIYLQSIKSPITRPFFQTDNFRNQQTTQNIYSQYVSPDETTYKEVCINEKLQCQFTSNEICSGFVPNLHLPNFFLLVLKQDSFVDDSEEETDEEEEWNSTIRSTENYRKQKSDDQIKSDKKKRRRIIEMSSDSDST